MDSFYDKAGVYTLHGDILHSLGQDYEAVRYLKAAFGFIDSQNVCSFTETHLNWADYLCDKGAWSEAAQTINEAIDTHFPASDNFLYRYKLYLKLSDIYHALGKD